jgi:hypothetical protein
MIEKTLGIETEPGDVVFDDAHQRHAAGRHPVEYPLILPHLGAIIANPLYLGDDFLNPGKIEFVSRIGTIKEAVLVAVSLERDHQGRYQVSSLYTVREVKIENRRRRGFLRIAIR